MLYRFFIVSVSELECSFAVIICDGETKRKILKWEFIFEYFPVLLKCNCHNSVTNFWTSTPYPIWWKVQYDTMLWFDTLYQCKTGWCIYVIKFLFWFKIYSWLFYTPIRKARNNLLRRYYSFVWRNANFYWKYVVCFIKNVVQVSNLAKILSLYEVVSVLGLYLPCVYH